MKYPWPEFRMGYNSYSIIVDATESWMLMHSCTCNSVLVLRQRMLVSDFKTDPFPRLWVSTKVQICLQIIQSTTRSRVANALQRFWRDKVNQKSQLREKFCSLYLSLKTHIDKELPLVSLKRFSSALGKDILNWPRVFFFFFPKPKSQSL